MEDLGNMVMVMSIGSGAPKCPCFCIHQKIKKRKIKYTTAVKLAQESEVPRGQSRGNDSLT